ncbi:hypothetical protein BGZ46_001657 [Entomortierella lignicola]|nr:hypothetical protein BGZ46_001657 [Entomortierella lignicola]
MSYKWIKPLVDRASLPSMPNWCIKHLNANARNSTDISQTMQSLTLSTRSPTLLHCQDENITLFVAQVETRIENELGCKMALPLRPRTTGFDFCCETAVTCTLCGKKIHTSNHYKARQIFGPCFHLRSYSDECVTRAYNWESDPILKQVIEYPTKDIPYCHILNAVFRGRGYTLNYAYNRNGSDGRFLCFNGIVWEELPRNVIVREIESVCGNVLDTLIKYVKPSRNSNARNIVEMYKNLFADNDIENKLDTDPDLIVARNGVIDLRTGELRKGLPEDYMTTQLDTDYNGLESSTKDIDAFVEDIFNGNTDFIEYVQRLLGYGITGHTGEQCWAIFTGSGSNGKSLFIGLIEKLLEKWYVAAPYDIFFKSNRRVQAGGPSPHLGMLKGARICVKEETEPKDELNIEMIKIVTGESPVTSRAMYAKDYETFMPTALPILLCNHKPTIDVDDDAMLRRIKVVPFTNIYTTPEDSNRPYDKHDPRHRLRDPNKRKELLSEYSQEQLLVWLVRGAVKWYAGGLGKLPECMKDAFNKYYTENDKLHEFIDELCEVSKEYRVNAGEFREAFKDFLGRNVQQKDLIEMMKRRGFQHVVAKDGKSSVKVYKGLQFSCL